jgi:Spy/CpxP family protein refolding chaperone
MRVVQFAMMLACCAAALSAKALAEEETAPAGAPAEQAAPAAAPAATTTETTEAPVGLPGRHAHRRASSSSLDARVKLLTTELKLTPQQQQSVRKILEDQRQQVARAWSDTSVPSAVRVKATQAIGDRTADQIRALLTEEQRAKYVKPRQPGTSAASADVEQWMNAAARRNP